MPGDANGDEAVEGRRAGFGCFLIVWGLTIFPLFVLGTGFSGGFWPTLRGLLAAAAAGDPVSIALLVCSLPLLFVPYWLWAELQHWKEKQAR